MLDFFYLFRKEMRKAARARKRDWEKRNAVSEHKDASQDASQDSAVKPDSSSAHVADTAAKAMNDHDDGDTFDLMEEPEIDIDLS